MRVARLLSMLLAVTVAVVTGLLAAPSATAEPPFRVPDYVTDNAGVLSQGQRIQVENAVNRLYNDKRIRLWVVYVDEFGQDPDDWVRTTMELSDFGDRDALLAVAVTERAYRFQVPSAIASQSTAESIQRNDVEPALRRDDWTAAAVAAADGLGTASSTTSTSSPMALVIALGVLIILALALWLWLRRRRRKRHEAEVAAAHRVDPTDPHALASVPLEALDELSKTIVVDVDNAVRTSEHEVTLAVEEFGPQQTEPFRMAVDNAKATLKQAFNARQILDDAVPETPLQRRDLLTRVVVAAAKADRALDEQSDAFEKLRDLVINAPTRLDGLTQQMVSLSARVAPAQQTLGTLKQQFSASALASVSENVDTAQQRLAFADKSIGDARSLLSRPGTSQTPLVDAIHGAEGALGQARTLLDAVDNAATDIHRATAGLPAAIADIQSGIDSATVQLQQPKTPQAAELSAARDAAMQAVATAKAEGTADPLGAFTQLTKADAELDRILASVDAARKESEKQARTLEQAMFTAQSRIKGVSDFIDTRRGSIGPEARTRLSEAIRQLEAAQAKRESNPAEAIAHANGAATLAARAQSLANDDVRAAQRHAYSSQHRGGGSDLGSVIGGIIIGSVLRGGFGGGRYGGGWGGGYGGGWGGGRSPGRPTSYGGSSHSSGRSYSGGGGRF